MVYLPGLYAFFVFLNQGLHHSLSSGIHLINFVLKAGIGDPTEIWEEVSPVDFYSTHHRVNHSPPYTQMDHTLTHLFVQQNEFLVCTKIDPFQVKRIEFQINTTPVN